MDRMLQDLFYFDYVGQWLSKYGQRTPGGPWDPFNKFLIITVYPAQSHYLRIYRYASSLSSRSIFISICNMLLFETKLYWVLVLFKIAMTSHWSQCFRKKCLMEIITFHLVAVGISQTDPFLLSHQNKFPMRQSSMRSDNMKDKLSIFRFSSLRDRI